MAKVRILFVDDDPNILSGLQRMLRPMRGEWDIACATSGAAALQMLEMEPADIVVSDMRMPGMTGSQLLRDVMKRYPSVVRIALSGQADEESTFSAIGPTHQYLTKPCDGETLKQTIRRACALRSLLANEALLKIISRIESLPSLPQQYLEIERELRSPEPSIQNVGGIVARDIAMAAKVLQLVNSAFFGLTRHVSSPQMATSLLGLETIRARWCSPCTCSPTTRTRAYPGSPWSDSGPIPCKLPRLPSLSLGPSGPAPK